MDIRIESLIKGAARASGAVAIIDVFRAFTTAAVAFANGATRITMVASVEEALALRERGVGQICMGEVGGRPIEGFDFGNSPCELSRVDLSGVAIIQRTSAGTQGIITAAKAAQHVFAASLVTVSATAQALRLIANDRITLVAMGENAKLRSSEDEICALYLRNLLEGSASDDPVRRRGCEVQRCEPPMAYSRGRAFRPPTDERIGSDNALPAESSGLEKLLLVLAVVPAALVFLPLKVDTALLHWKHHWG